MPKFDDLTPLQRDWLAQVVAFGREEGEATFWLRFFQQGASPILTCDGSPHRYNDLPPGRFHHVALAQLGYLAMPEDHADCFTLCQRAYDCADHWAKRRIPRAWADLVYDLGHNATIRSKLAWMAIAVVVSQFVTLGLARLGVL